jgi:hemoglobin
MYAGRDMQSVHARLGVTNQDFDLVIRHLVATLVELDVPSELIIAVGTKLEPLRALVVAQSVAA